MKKRISFIISFFVIVIFIKQLQPLSNVKKEEICQIDEKYAAMVTKNALSLTEPVIAKILKGGYSGSPIFVVTSASKRYVIRFVGNKSKKAMREEITCCKIASKQGYGPYVYFVDAVRGIIIMEFLSNQDIQLQQRQSDSLYISLANLLRKIHFGPKFEGYRNVFEDILEHINVVKKNLEIQNIDNIPLIKLEEIIKIISETFALDTTIVSCHNDLSPVNLMFLGNEFKAIDYEYAAQSNPFCDIAEIAIFYCTNPTHEEILLSTYLGRKPYENERAKLYLMKLVNWIYYAVFFLEINQKQLHEYENLQIPLEVNLIKKMAEGATVSVSTECLLKYAKALINHVIKNFESQEFKDAIKILRESYKIGDCCMKNLDNLKLNLNVKKQIHDCVNLIKEIFEQDLLGIYLYGSSILGGLQKYSDIDLFVVSNRATNREEKAKLVAALLKISGIYMKSKKRPIEITIVEKSEINPWNYPPRFDFQYGEWLRKQFEHGNIELWTNKEMSDLALIVTQILLASRTLIGVNPNQLLCNVPYKDFMTSMIDSLPNLMLDLNSDIRNVLLTLARIWGTVATDMIYSKPVAADWVINRLPEQYRSVMKRAMLICKGEEKEHWDDIQELIKPCANFMLNEINNKITEIMLSDNLNRSIRIA